MWPLGEIGHLQAELKETKAKVQERQGEEYRTLRADIDRNSHIATTVFLATTTVTSAPIGYGLSSKLGPILLRPFTIIIPSLLIHYLSVGINHPHRCLCNGLPPS
jgi:hypothetical protein